MQFISSVTQKGQATIPALIRKKLGIKPNSKITFELINDQEVIIKPVDDFFALKGSIKTDKPFDLAAMEQAIVDGFKHRYVPKKYP